MLRKVPLLGIFLSTLSLRRATIRLAVLSYYQDISIHALLAESDYDTSSLMRCQVKISIHALLAESDTYDGLIASANFCISIHALLAESDIIIYNHVSSRKAFLSTLSLRRATIAF